MLPNQEMSALKHPSNQKPENWRETKFEEMYGPNWREIVPGYND